MAVLALVGTGTVSTARATELHWQAPIACPSQGDLLSDVERLLNRPLRQFDTGTFLVQVSRRNDRYSARLEYRTAPGAPASAVRRLQAGSCEQLSEMVALAVALSLGLIDSPGGYSTPTPGALSAQSPPDEVESPSIDPKTTNTQRRVDSPNTVATRLQVSLTGDSGSLPAPALGVSGGMQWHWAAVVLRLEAAWYTPRSKAVDPQVSETAGAEVGMWTAAAQGCSSVSAPSAALPLSLCAGVESGQLTGIGVGVTAPRRGKSRWGALRFDLETAHQPLQGAIGYFASVGVGIPLTRDEFVLRGIGTVYQPGTLVARARIGAIFSLW